jgi:hypothetical protein
MSAVKRLMYAVAISLETGRMTGCDLVNSVESGGRSLETFGVLSKLEGFLPKLHGSTRTLERKHGHFTPDRDAERRFAPVDPL